MTAPARDRRPVQAAAHPSPGPDLLQEATLSAWRRASLKPRTVGLGLASAATDANIVNSDTQRALEPAAVWTRHSKRGGFGIIAPDGAVGLAPIKATAPRVRGGPAEPLRGRRRANTAAVFP